MRKFVGLTLMMGALIMNSVSAQDCANFHKRKCMGSDNPYMVYNTQSKSGMFILGHTSDLVIVAHAGQDYHISLCQDGKVEEPIKFKILDGRTKEVLFDSETNTTEGGVVDSFEFTCDLTKKIIIRIIAPGPPPQEGGGGKGKSAEPDPESLFCVGVLVENMATPKLGF